MAKYDLIVVGGTGQWVLYELCRQALYGLGAGPVQLPDGLRIIDADYGQRDESGVSQKLRQLLPLAYQSHGKKIDFDSCLIRPDIPKGQSKLGTLLTNDLGLLGCALTDDERTPDVSVGFFARPRLAASWVSVQGFEKPKDEFLQPGYWTKDGTLVPTLIVGSIMGGTGAGIIPYLLHASRNEVNLALWRRQVTVVAVLPWFNPELASTSGVDAGAHKVTWDECCHNTAGGIAAIKKVLSNIESRYQTVDKNSVPNPALAACCVAGIPREIAKNNAPPSIREQANDLPVHPLICELAAALPDLANPIAATMQQTSAVVFGALAVPGVSGDEAGPLVAPAAQGTTAHSIRWAAGAPLRTLLFAVVARARVQKQREAGRRLAVLADQPMANSITGVFAHVKGFGTVLGDILMTVRRPGKKEYMALFCEHLVRNLKVLATNLSSDNAMKLNLDAIIEELDKAADGVTRGRLLELADCADGRFSAAEIDERTREIATLLRDLLTPRFAGGDVPKIPAKVSVVLVPDDRDPTDNLSLAEVGTRQIQGVGIAGWSDEESRLAQQSWSKAAPGVCDSRNRASVLSLSHALADSVPMSHGAKMTFSRHDPLGHVTLLWRAALHGLLTVDTIANEGKHRDWYAKTENLDLTVGGPLRYVRWANDPEKTVLGFLTAELGFVPHADLVEKAGAARDAGSQHPIRLAWAKLTDHLSADHAEQDLAQLGLFASAMSARVSCGFGDRPAWARLILCQNDPRRTYVVAQIDQHLLPSSEIPLHVVVDGLQTTVVGVPIPRGFETENIRRTWSVVAGLATATNLVRINGPMLEFSAHPKWSHTVAILDGERIKDLCVDDLAVAARAVPPANAAPAVNNQITLKVRW